jgi:hypothetical protein
MVLLLSFHCDWPLGVPPAALFPLLLATSACCRENRYRPRVGGDGEHALPGSSVGPRWGWSHEIFCRCPGVPHKKKKKHGFVWRKTTRTLCLWSVEFLLSYNLSLAGQLQWIVPTKISPTKISSGYPPWLKESYPAKSYCWVGRSSTNYMQQNLFISRSNIAKVYSEESSCDHEDHMSSCNNGFS